MKKLGLWILVIMLSISGCKEEIYKFPVQVLTQDAKKTKATSVQAEAIFINPSEESITEKGFYYTVNDSASRILENKAIVADTGFSKTLMSLQANTEYSYFAFAKTASNDVHGPVKPRYTHSDWSRGRGLWHCHYEVKTVYDLFYSRVCHQ
jgi:hypothetical protein